MIGPVQFRSAFSAVQPVKRKEQSVAHAPQFSGYHPDAVVGIDTKVSGTSNYAKHTSELFFKLQKGGELEKKKGWGYKTEFPLLLIREAHNEHDPNAIAIYTDRTANGLRRKLGHVPAELAKHIAPMIDRGQPFSVTLTSIVPFKTGEGVWNHGLQVRLEHITKPGQAPNPKVKKQVEKAFAETVEAELKVRQETGSRTKRVLNVYAEEMHSYRLPEQNRRLIERVDRERQEASYYLGGKLIGRADLASGNVLQLEAEDVPSSVQKRLTRRLDQTV